MKESNFPENLVKVFVGRAVDMARQCVEAPLRRTPKYVKWNSNCSVLSQSTIIIIIIILIIIIIILIIIIIIITVVMIK